MDNQEISGIGLNGPYFMQVFPGIRKFKTGWPDAFCHQAQGVALQHFVHEDNGGYIWVGPCADIPNHAERPKYDPCV